MNDFLLIIPKEWDSFNTISFSAENCAMKENDDACLIIDQLNSHIPDSNLLEILIDYQGVRVFTKGFQKEVFVKNRAESVDFSYIIHVDAKNKSIIVSSCFFGVIPVYYYEDRNKLWVSNRARLIADRLRKKPVINDKFLVEMALFNYSFQNDSIFKDIMLLPANTYLIWNGRLQIEKYFFIEDLFCTNPKSTRNSIDSLRDIFLTEMEKYFTIAKSAISFTSGFDGRTILACSRYYHKYFDTYSFGTENNDDVYVPKATAERLGIPYLPIILDNEYAENAFYSDGNELIELTDGNNNLLKVHHLFSAKIMSRSHDCLLNGMFGSELFRSVHISGQVTSRELVTIFSTDNQDKMVSALRQTSHLECFNKHVIDNVLDRVITEIVDYKKCMTRLELSKNQQIYKYVYEEAFRKNFGYSIAAQMKYINVRSPYLNIIFMKELFKSKLAGVNNDFFTHNPLKRFKGQLLYAKIIEKACPLLFKEKTTKGYSPENLMSCYGKARVALGYAKTKLIRKMGVNDYNNLMILSGIEKNNKKMQMECIPAILNPNMIKKIPEYKLNNSNRDIRIRFLSIIHYINNYMSDQFAKQK